MELIVKLENNADISFIKKLLLQLKDVKSVDVSEYEMSDEEYSNLLDKVLKKSIQEADNGKTKELTPELLNEIFK